MHIRCQYCGNPFNLGREYIVQAVSEATEKKQKQHVVECNKCRKKLKVPIKQMRRYLPKEKPAEEKKSK